MSDIKPVYQAKICGDGNFAQITELHYKEIADIETVEKRILYPAAAYEALQKENESLKWQKDNAARLGLKANEALKAENERLTKNLLGANADFEKYERKYYLELNKVEDLTAESAAQAKRIEELEAATDHLGLTPKQAADGLARYKAQVAEIESLRKQVEALGQTAPTASGFCSMDGGCVCGGDLPRIRESCSSWVKPASKNGE